MEGGRGEEGDPVCIQERIARFLSVAFPVVMQPRQFLRWSVGIRFAFPGWLAPGSLWVSHNDTHQPSRMLRTVKVGGSANEPTLS